MRCVVAALLICGSLCLSAAEPPAFNKDIVFAEAEGETLKLDAYVPEGPGPFPVAIGVHGGGWTKGDKDTQKKSLYEPLRLAGFVVFSINYRLSPKFHFPAMNNDVDAGIRWVKEHAKEYKGDANRIALVGDSAGGYLVTYAAAHGKEGVNAVVAIYPPTNLESRVRNSGKMLTAGALTGLTEVNETTFQKLHEISPIYMLRANMPPHLILHGDKDAQVPFQQSVEYQLKMREIGNACELVKVPNGAHGLPTFDKIAFDYRTPIIEWLTKTLK